MHKKCDIVIPVFNSPMWVELCIQAAVFSDVNGYINSIIVIDDCSDLITKQLLMDLEKKYDMLKIIQNNENLGFVKSTNKGMKSSNADFIMLLNSDCLLACNTVMKLIDKIEIDKSIGLICPISNNAANLSFPIPKGLNYIQTDKLLEKVCSNKVFDACTVVGNCLVISRECYNDVGGLDEIYGMGYGEETDYQFRAATYGYNSVVACDTYVFHKSQVSFGNSEILNERKQNNRNIFFSRWEHEYNLRMKDYKNNDPIKFIYSVLTATDIASAKRINIDNFSNQFLTSVKKIDNSKDNQTQSLPKNSLISKGIKTIKTYGIKTFLKKTFGYFVKKTKNLSMEMNFCHYSDILIVYDKCRVNRAKTLKNQVEFYDMIADFVCIDDMKVELMRDFSCFIFIDCDCRIIGQYATYAKERNKSIFIDISDKRFLPNENSIHFDGVMFANKNVFSELETLNHSSYRNYIADFDFSLAEDIYQNDILESGYCLTKFIRDNMSKSIAFVLPSTDICGGVNVVAKHCEILLQKGYNAFIINLDYNIQPCVSGSTFIDVISSTNTKFIGHIDKIVATFWSTNKFIDENLYNYNQRYYLVQGYETDFYPIQDVVNRKRANSTYVREDIWYLCVSKWCTKWLTEKYFRKPTEVINGLDLTYFEYKERDFNSKINILIEGDPDVDYKNVDESFRITEKLDREKFNIIFVSNNASPKKAYQYDKFYSKIPYSEMSKVYQESHILIKTSLLESFSYPPLEMMATGGLVMAIQNDGNSEFLVDNKNCLIINHNDINDSVRKIHELMGDAELRNKLTQNGLKTAACYSWGNVARKIVEAYE